MIKIGLDELERARRLQEEAAKLHLPSPPVVSFKISRKTNNGKVEDVIHAKSNSYVRHAYNMLMTALTFAPQSAVDRTYFGDGTLSFKNILGDITGRPSLTSGSPLFDLVLGTNGTPETLDDYVIEEIPLEDWAGTQNITSEFEPSSRRFITRIRKNMFNSSQTTYEIRESGIYFGQGSSAMSPSVTYLMIRDTFPPVIFAPGNQINFTYQLEVYYPPVNF